MDNKGETTDSVKQNIKEIELPKPGKEQQADFSQIFGAASEEKVEIPTSEKEIPKVKEQSIEQPKIEKKPVQYNGTEKVLFEIEPEKEASPVVPAIFFAILLSCIFLLPYVSKHFDFTFIPLNEVQQSGEETEGEYYFFEKSSVRAKIGDLEFTNFVKSSANDEYHISFTITNTALRTYRFDKKYYVVLYDANENVLFYSLIYSYEAIGAMGAQTITLNITENAFKKSNRFKIEELSIDSYPKVNLVEKEGEYEVMKCTYHNNTIKYYFKEDKLVKIYDVYKETLNQSKDYASSKAKYQSLSEKYKTVPNFSSIFIETNEDFQMINEFELSKITEAQLAELNTFRFFRYGESKDVISFELESQAYTCS